MNSDNFGGAAHPETLDADAVCAQCNTVNSEGTLLCKVCGNNLRDQRAIRLAADQALDLEYTGRRRRAWVSGAMFVLAIFLIISTLLNQEMIVSWLIGVGSSSAPVASVLWSGPYRDVFDPMVQALEARAVTEESARSAMETPADLGTLDGIYGLFQGDTYVGAALARLDGSDLYFVALLENGGEARGRGVAEGNHYTATAEHSAIQERRGIVPVRGVAMPQGGGVVDCIGDDNVRIPVSLTAYRMPSE